MTYMHKQLIQQLGTLCQSQMSCQVVKGSNVDRAMVLAIFLLY